jgi:hypothetical protein
MQKRLKVLEYDTCRMRRRAWIPVLKRERDEPGNTHLKKPSRKAKGLGKGSPLLTSQSGLFCKDSMISSLIP